MRESLGGAERKARFWLLTIGLLTASGTFAGGEDASAIRTIVTSEEQILALTPGLTALSKGLLDLQLPDTSRRALFAPTVEVIDLEDSGEAGWKPSPDKTIMTAASDQLWSSLLGEVAYFEHTKFAIVKGYFQKGDPKGFMADVDFSAVARMQADH
ncbi:MAG: hypothetical protein AAF514_05430, partial [Verrucomicrobiota bacterium]